MLLHHKLYLLDLLDDFFTENEHENDRYDQESQDKQL